MGGELSNIFIFALQIGMEHSLRLSATLQNILAKSRMSLCQIRPTSPCVCRNYSRLSCYFHGKSYGIMELRLCLACLLNCSETMRHWTKQFSFNSNCYQGLKIVWDAIRPSPSLPLLHSSLPPSYPLPSLSTSFLSPLEVVTPNCG